MLNHTLDIVPKMQSESTFPPSSNVRYETVLVTNVFSAHANAKSVLEGKAASLLKV